MSLSLWNNFLSYNKKLYAVCDIRKFREYIFGEKGRNEGKVEIFQMLGFTIEDSEYLKKNMKGKH